MRNAILMLTVIIALTVSVLADACDWDTGERDQRVYLSWDGQRISNWIASPNSTERVELPNGFELGVKLEAAELQRYKDLEERLNHIPELVKISLYDLGESEPMLLTYTYGGTNSLQTYGSSGGADRVDELGDPGILMTVLKPVCVKSTVVNVAR